ncbi:MAG TPA: S41 family peptidase [Allosphingosinicella sp.]|nr:S41 family peptidase [Allosphingosinicella sp.]
MPEVQVLRSLFLFLCLGLAAPAGAQSLTAQQKREIAGAAATAYADFYVFADRGAAIAAHLRREAGRGAFDRIDQPQAFAAALTAAIRTVQADRHLEILPPRPATSTTATAGPPSRAERLSWIEPLRRRNYDFVRVERLPGNVGYLRLDSFPPPELAASTAAAAMAFLRHCDAIIIDLRENGGGTGDMVRFLASYFFVEPTRLSRTFRRDRNPQTSYDMTLPSIPGDRIPIADIFVLTSNRTISAAEAFAFALQQQGRAVVIGETTAGAGNAGDYLDIGHGFRAFVPDVHVSSPVNETSWEGVGVRPDIAATSEQGLATAHREALQRLLSATTDERRRAALRRAMANPAR